VLSNSVAGLLPFTVSLSSCYTERHAPGFDLFFSASSFLNLACEHLVAVPVPILTYNYWGLEPCELSWIPSRICSWAPLGVHTAVKNEAGETFGLILQPVSEWTSSPSLKPHRSFNFPFSSYAQYLFSSCFFPRYYMRRGEIFPY